MMAELCEILESEWMPQTTSLFSVVKLYLKLRRELNCSFLKSSKWLWIAISKEKKLSMLTTSERIILPRSLKKQSQVNLNLRSHNCSFQKMNTTKLSRVSMVTVWNTTLTKILEDTQSFLKLQLIECFQARCLADIKRLNIISTKRSVFKLEMKVFVSQTI